MVPANESQMTAPPKRRWFRFSLRTMFVLVAALGVPLAFLAWQFQIYRVRHAAWRRIEDNRYELVYGWYTSMPSPPRFFAFRKAIFGDQHGVKVVILPLSTPLREVGELQRAFPETLFAFEGEDQYIDTIEK